MASDEPDTHAAHDPAEAGSGPGALTFTNVQTLRQGSAIAAGVLGLAGGLVLTVPTLLGPNPSWGLVSAVVLVLVLVWLYVVRPSVKLHDQGVRIVNPLSTVDLTWPAISEARSRWNLELSAGEKRYVAWAVTASSNRPRHGRAIFQLGAGKQLAKESVENQPPRSKVEASTVAAEIRARIEADAREHAGRTPRVATQSWHAASIGLLAAAIVFVVLAVLI